MSSSLNSSLELRHWSFLNSVISCKSVTLQHQGKFQHWSSLGFFLSPSVSGNPDVVVGELFFRWNEHICLPRIWHNTLVACIRNQMTRYYAFTSMWLAPSSP
ncbi:hypothetical protein AKJ16_DCAP11253 [Drosera capensis]